MKTILQLEEVAVFVACLFVYPHLHLSWWWFALCILLPDASMIGYAHSPRTGAWMYNLFHHRGVALLLAGAGYYGSHIGLLFAGFVLFAHATMDRMVGYGLKYEKGFRYTHLGEIGKPAPASAEV